MNNAIIYLVDSRADRLIQLCNSLINLKNFYLHRFPTPVYLLVEQKDANNLYDTIKQLIQISGVQSAYIPITLPDLSKWDAGDKIYHQGYRQMCALFSY